jgi:ClpA/ClpB-like protein
VRECSSQTPELAPFTVVSSAWPRLGFLIFSRSIAKRLFRALGSLGVKVDEVRAGVVQIAGAADKIQTSQIPFTPHVKEVLEGALKEALQLDHRSIGTEHILLGLARLNDGVAAKVLLARGVDAERIRTEVSRLLSDPAYAKQVEADAPSTAMRHVMTRTSAPVHDVEPGTLSRTVGELLASLAETDERSEVELAIDSALRALTIGQLLDAVIYTKETYIEDRAFESAARFRDLELRLVKALAAVPPEGA